MLAVTVLMRYMSLSAGFDSLAIFVVLPRRADPRCYIRRPLPIWVFFTYSAEAPEGIHYE
ncbi:hypothetical protein ASG91_00140 [Phycicoccus sp. Soil802]|nr:hypothetical protein ASG91_00140 [Phycicoccus sp. Soil802]